MERPKRYVSTIWKAARKINGNISHTVRPTLLEKDERRVYNPQGSNILHSAMKNGWRSVTTRARFGIVRETTKATISMYVPIFLFIIVYFLYCMFSERLVDIEQETTLAFLAETVVEAHIDILLELPTIADTIVGEHT